MTDNICVFNRSMVFFHEGVIHCTNDVKTGIAGKLPNARIAPWTGEDGGFIAPQPIMAAPPIVGPDNGFCPWIVYADDMVLLFLPNRIEVSNSSFVINEEDELSILKSLLDKLVSFVELFKINSIKRFAYVPQTGIDETETFNVNDYFKKTINLPKLETWRYEEPAVHLNFPTTMTIASKDYEVNRLCNIIKGQKKSDSNDYDCVIINNDINTFGRKEYEFSFGDADDFMTQAVKMHFQVLKHLF